jgi:CBS domain containing-hemolysin-like protein
VHEDFTLYQALQAFLKTKHHLFLVVNSFEELVGILTIEDVLEQMIGKPIVDEFDRYDDLRAVAAAAAKKDHVNHNEPKLPSESDVSAG